MNFRLGARQFFEQQSAHAPQLPYDAEVKWLESTSTQYIDTGITADQDILLECAGRLTDVSITTAARHVVHAYSSGRITFGWLLGRNQTFGLAALTTSPVVADADTEWHSVIICSTAESPYYEFDGEKSYLTPQSSVLSLGTINLFANGSTNGAFVRISYVKISRPSTGQTLADLIPVRFANELGESEGAMYDRVSGALFRNQGTGKFIVGADADMPYDREVKYVEYHSTNFDSTFSIPFSESVLSRFRGKKFDEIDWSAKGTVSRIDNGGNIVGIGGGSGLGGVGPYMSGGSSPPSIYAGTASTGSVVCQTLDDYHSVGVSISSGIRYGQIDGGEIVASSVTTTATIDESKLVFLYASKRSGTQSGTKFRQSDVEVKIGDETVVDGRPVVTADGAIGWYDYVSRQVYSAPSSTTGLSAGPVVSNEGPRPYAYKVQYIETDGVASYIDTGVTADGFDFKLKFNFAFVGDTDTVGGTNVMYLLNKGWTVVSCLSNGVIVPASGFTFDTTGNVFYECEVQWFIGDKYAKVDGTTLATSSTTTVFDPNKNFVIGANTNSSSGIKSVGHVKCAKFQIFDNDGNCKFNGIPVVDRNGVSCMYDYISKTLKYNAASSGMITAGPPI